MLVNLVRLLPSGIRALENGVLFLGSELSVQRRKKCSFQGNVFPLQTSAHDKMCEECVAWGSSFPRGVLNFSGCHDDSCE